MFLLPNCLVPHSTPTHWNPTQQGARETDGIAPPLRPSWARSPTSNPFPLHQWPKLFGLPTTGNGAQQLAWKQTKVGPNGEAPNGIL